MSNSELISFFNEASSFTEFERRKKIYELTNNLDIDLLYDLKKEYSMYIFSLKLKLKLEKDKSYEQNLLPLNSRQSEDFNIQKTYIDIFLQDNKRLEGKNEITDEADIFGLIQDLINRKLVDLPKNSRHKNDVNYFSNQSDTYDYYSLIIGDDYYPSKTDELIDLSDNSLVGKIIYLEKLGIIDFLRSQRPFSTSVNSVATVFSAITGAKATSIQPLLNPLLGKDVYSKNNPLNSHKNVVSVEQVLNKMGFDFAKKK